LCIATQPFDRLEKGLVYEALGAGTFRCVAHLSNGFPARNALELAKQRLWGLDPAAVSTLRETLFS
jgi:hypothetical protein